MEVPRDAGGRQGTWSRRSRSVVDKGPGRGASASQPSLAKAKLALSASHHDSRLNVSPHKRLSIHYQPQLPSFAPSALKLKPGTRTRKHRQCQPGWSIISGRTIASTADLQQAVYSCLLSLLLVATPAGQISNQVMLILLLLLRRRRGKRGRCAQLKGMNTSRP